MALGTIYRTTATFLMTALALRVHYVHSFRCILAFRIMTFTTGGRGVSFILNIMVTITAGDAVTIFGKMPLMIKEYIAACIF